jgi:hypothetical protein
LSNRVFLEKAGFIAGLFYADAYTYDPLILCDLKQ